MRIHPGRLAAALALALSSALPAMAGDLLIGQFRTRGPAGGNDEFVQLYNKGSSSLDLSGYRLMGSSSTGATGVRATLAAGTRIGPGCYFLLTNKASGGYSGSVPGDATYSTGIADNGGLAIADPSGSVLDAVGLSTGSAYLEGTPLAPMTQNQDQAYERKPGASAGNGDDSGNNAGDFAAISPAVPRNSQSACVAQNEPTLPELRVADASVEEGSNGSNVPMSFTLALSQPAGSAGVRVRAYTEDGTATVADGDYQPLDSTLTIPAGATEAQVTVQINGDARIEPDESFKLRLADAEGASIVVGEALGTIRNDDLATVEIWQIQGSGMTSPLAGQRVGTVDNIVTGIGEQGFSMQTPDARDDNDPLTSNGVYVYTGSRPQVQVGDAVNVVGTVEEYYGLTELKNATISVLGSGNPLPSALLLGKQQPSENPAQLSCGASNYECMEGMRVSMDAGVVARANQRFTGTPYAEVFVTADGARAVREPGLLYGQTPAKPSIPIWDANPQEFEMDTAWFGALPAGTPLTGGTRFKADGVMGYSFGDYVFWPTRLQVTQAHVIPELRKPAERGVLRLASFNVLRLCDTDPANTTYACGDSGEPDEAQLARKIERLSQYIGNVLGQPDVLGVQEVENLAVLQRLADRLNSDWGTHYAAYLKEGNDPSGIDVGFLVRNEHVRVRRVTQLLADLTWTDPRDGQTRRLMDRPPLLLDAVFKHGGFGPFKVMVIHPKSMVGLLSGSDAERNRLKRFEEARAIAGEVQKLQSHYGFLRSFVVLGDFNAYPFTDGIVDVAGIIGGTYDDAQNALDLGGNLVRPALWNGYHGVPRSLAYSYLYTDQLGPIQGYMAAGSRDRGREVPTAQVIDQALLSVGARARFVRMQYGRTNVDAPDQTKLDAETAPGAAGAVGVSDHDGLILDLRGYFF